MRPGTETRLEKGISLFSVSSIEIKSLSDEILNALFKVFEHIEKDFSMRKLGSRERVENLSVLLANGTIPPTFQDYTAHDCCTAIKNCLNPITPLLCYYTEEMRSYDFQNAETMKKIIQKCKSKDVLKFRLLERLVQHMEKLIYGNTNSISTSEEEIYQNLGNLIVKIPNAGCPQSLRLELYAQIPIICKSLLNNFQYLFSPLSPKSDDDDDDIGKDGEIKLLNKTLVRDEELELLKRKGNGCFSFGSNKKIDYPQIEDTPDITACLYGSLSELLLYIEQNYYIKNDIYLKTNIASTTLLDILYNPPSRSLPIDFSSYEVDVLFSTLLKTFITIGPIITYYTYDLVKYNFSDVKFVKQLVKELKKLNPIRYELLYRIKSHIIDMSRFSDYNSLTKDKLCEIFGQYLIKIHPKEFHKSVLNSFKNQGVEVCKLIVNHREIERILPVNILEQSIRYDNQLPESAYLHDVKIQPFFNRVLLSNSSSINNMSPSTSKFKSKNSPILLSPRGPPPKLSHIYQHNQQPEHQLMNMKRQQPQQPLEHQEKNHKNQQESHIEQQIPLPPQLSSSALTLAPPLKTKRKLTESARIKSKELLAIVNYDEVNIFSSMYSDDGIINGMEQTERILLDPQQSEKTIKILQQQISDYQEIINIKNDSNNHLNNNNNDDCSNIETMKNREMQLNSRIKELENEVLTWKKKCKASINKLKEKIEIINKLNSEVNVDKESSEKMKKENSEMKTSYNALQSDLEASRKEYDELNKEKCKMKRDFDKEKREMKEEYEKKIEDIQKLYENEMKMRIELYNELVNLRGNIRVYCRIRPLNSFTSIDNQVLAPITILNESEISVDNMMGSTTTYCFDRIFSKDSTQDELFSDIENFILSALDGFNVCIFAYGQTGSGKTFTMQGTLQNPGIYNHTLQLLFDKIEVQKQYNYQISISIMEIYNDSIRDLTYPIANRKSLEIKTKVTGDNYVEGLVEVPIRTYSDVIPIFNQASKNRSVGAHNLNERSSRSHLIFIVNINKTNPVNGETKLSQINLIDLAGSERISKTKAEGDRLKEAQYINKSLSALGEVINHLSTKSKHIPFRNSKLTHFLQQSLTSDSKVAMFVTINPQIDQLSESICSLQFANRCKEVEINQAKRIVSRYAIDQKATST